MTDLVPRRHLRVLFIGETDKHDETLLISKDEFGSLLNSFLFDEWPLGVNRVVLNPRFGRARKLVIDRAG